MSQSNMNVGNVSAPQFRSDMNAALQALASTSSGSAAPSTTYANQLWYDTAANILKMRNEANSAWINLLYIEQTGAVRVLDDTQVVNTSGTQTGLLGDQTTATWQAGTGTVESLVSPAKIKAAIDALATPVATFSASTSVGTGTSVDVTGVPASAREIEIHFFGVSLNDSSNLLVQLLVGGTPVTSGYVSASGNSGAEIGSTSGLVVYQAASTRLAHGILRIVRAASGSWASTHAIGMGGSTAASSGGGTVTGVGTVNGVRLTVAGAGNFDAGSIVVSWR